MFKKICFVLAAGLSILWTGIAFAAPDMQEGMWEMTFETKMEGMPMAPMKMKHKQCLTKKDMVPQKQEKGQDCKTTNTQMSGDTVSWAIICKDKNGTTEGSGKITYKGNKFDGTMNMTMTSAKGEKMKMSQKMGGQRIGDCK